MMDIGSKMSFKNIADKTQEMPKRDMRASYSLSNIKEPEEKTDQIVKIDISQLETAPEAWNFYPKLEGEEFVKLVKSIYEHGLLHPIVVRKREDRHIILSGHNRVRAYKQIKLELEEIQNGNNAVLLEIMDDEKFNIKDYEQIMAVIKEDITDDEAREIIIDANYVQRQLGQKLMTRSIIEKYKIIQDRRKNTDDDRYKNIKTREIVAQEFKLSGRHIDRYKKLESLNSSIIEEFYQGKISLELAAKLASLKPNVQEHIFKKHMKSFAKYPARTLENLKPSNTKADIDAMMKSIREDNDQARITIKEDGRSKNYVITEAETIEKIKLILSQYTQGKN